jgi:hypothetical protein
VEAVTPEELDAFLAARSQTNKCTIRSGCSDYACDCHDVVDALAAELRRLWMVEREYKCHWEGADLTHGDSRIVEKADAALERGEPLTGALAHDVLAIARDGAHTVDALRKERAMLKAELATRTKCQDIAQLADVRMPRSPNR